MRFCAGRPRRAVAESGPLAVAPAMPFSGARGLTITFSQPGGR